MRRKTSEWLILITVISSCLVAIYVACFLYVSSSVKYSESSIIAKDFQTHVQIQNYRHGNIHEIYHTNTANTETRKSYDKDKCQVADIVIVCAGFSAIRRMIPLLKSLLFYRTIPLHFHFVVNGSTSFSVLSTLFDTWSLPNVVYSIYDAHLVMDDLSWIPNKHYSGVYGLLKLTLPKILPADLKKVLVLDNDVLFNADVAELWNLWDGVDLERHMFGLAENLSPWYLGKLPIRYKPWPADGRGFNTGVILLNLELIRRTDWSNTWINATNTTIDSHGPLSLADQDVFNIVAKNNPATVYRLPCSWNLQLGHSSITTMCSKNMPDFKLVHFNSLEKTDARDAIALHFLHRQSIFLEMSTMPSKTEYLECSQFKKLKNLTKNGPPKNEDVCESFTTNLRHNIHLYYFGFSNEPNRTDVTLVTHLSFDRIQMLDYVLPFWTGPASIAVYLWPSDLTVLEDFISTSTVINKRHDISIHLIYKQGIHFPINKLRNIAVAEARTDYIFSLDADFIPALGLHEYLVEYLTNNPIVKKQALVVPAFEIDEYKPDRLPRSKIDIVKLYGTGTVQIFRHSDWSKGHASTNFQQWFNATKSYAIKMNPDFEPYLVLHKSAPLYDERFNGFGWNKVAHTMELESARYEFVVLPAAYAMHLPHGPSLELVKYRNSELYRRCLKMLKGQFIKELVRKYTVNNVNGAL